MWLRVFSGWLSGLPSYPWPFEIVWHYSWHVLDMEGYGDQYGVLFWYFVAHYWWLTSSRTIKTLNIVDHSNAYVVLLDYMRPSDLLILFHVVTTCYLKCTLVWPARSIAKTSGTWPRRSAMTCHPCWWTVKSCFEMFNVEWWFQNVGGWSQNWL